MARRLTLLEDPRYEEFVERYHGDALRFAVEVCGMEPSADQEDLLIAMSAPTAKVSVVSGTGTGKTATFARIALWHLLAFPFAFYEGKLEIGSNTYIGAPLVQQVGDGLWKEMQDTLLAIRNGPVAWIADYFTIGKTRVTVRGFEDQWFIAQIALAKGGSVGVAGKHRYWQLVIIDEAAGVPDDHFDVIDGTQTQGGNRTLMASQGVRSSGRFYESHHKLSHHNGGAWHSLRFNSENSPFVTLKWLRDRAVETGGKESVEYQIRVLGLFPELSDKFLLGRSAIEKRIEAGATIPEDAPYGNVIVIDVAAGVYRDKTVALHVRMLGNGDRLDDDARRVDVVDIPVFSNTLDWQDVVGQVVEYARLLSNCTFVVDVGGQGEQFARMMENAGLTNIVRVLWGEACFRKKNKQRFFNQRAQCSVHAAEAVKDARVSFTQKYAKDMLDQGSRIPYHFDEKARYHIMPKQQMLEQEGIKSPDLWDTVCMAFLDTVYYTVSDRVAGKSNGAKSAEALAEEMRAALAAELGGPQPAVSAFAAAGAWLRRILGRAALAAELRRAAAVIGAQLDAARAAVVPRIEFA